MPVKNTIGEKHFVFSCHIYYEPKLNLTANSFSKQNESKNNKNSNTQQAFENSLKIKYCLRLNFFHSKLQLL